VSRKIVAPIEKRIDERAGDLFAQLALLGHVLGDAHEHRAERAGGLRRTDHVREERGENPGVCGECGREI
jgi:hypothetical protein